MAHTAGVKAAENRPVPRVKPLWGSPCGDRSLFLVPLPGKSNCRSGTVGSLPKRLKRSSYNRVLAIVLPLHGTFPYALRRTPKMNNPSSPLSAAGKVIARGIHLELTEALKKSIEEKSTRLFRHQGRIDRLRVDLEFDKSKDVDHRFIAKGHIEIGGPDLLASVASDDAYKSIDLLVDKLDGLLRRRASEFKDKRQHPHGVEVPAALPKV